MGSCRSRRSVGLFTFRSRISWEYRTMSGDVLQNYDLASAALLNRPDVQVLSAGQERALVLELDGCKRRLLEVRQLFGGELSGTSPEYEEIQAIVRHLLNRSTVKTEVVR